MNINGVAAGAGDLGAAWSAAAEGQRPAAQPVPSGSKAALQAQAAREGNQPQKPAPAEDDAVSKDRAVFAVDGDKKVVIRILDGKGRVVMQIPPEEARSVKKELQELMKNLFSKEA
ncbi:MAG: hypothetical protein M0Z48_11965 [Nitrospiraceae bacterium]|nr:hypothetical protein [Nitrospiraceae bacterium]